MATFQLIREWTTEAGLPGLCIHAEFENHVKDILRQVHDEMDFPFEEFATVMGYPEPAMEWWCGYVGVKSDHPLFGIDVRTPCDFLILPDDEPIGARGVIPLLCAAASDEYNTPDVYFDVHGGLTYAGPSGDFGPPGDEVPAGFWWFGFDTMHACDNPENQNETYVKQECERLATDMAKVKVPKGNA